MLPFIEIKVRAYLTVYPLEYIQVEIGRYAGLVVISLMKNVIIFHQVNTDQKDRCSGLQCGRFFLEIRMPHQD